MSDGLTQVIKNSDTPQGIVHKPTDAAFSPYPDDAYSGITRLGQLGNQHPNGNSFRAEDVQRIMWNLWVEYVISNPRLFKTANLLGADPGAARFNWPVLQTQIKGGYN